MTFLYIYLNLDQACTIYFSNEWEDNRQGTALHEFMHAFWFEHEHWRKDRDHFVDVKDSNDEQYSIDRFSKELTIFDPFSVMLYSEDDWMKRNSGSRLWKLK